MTETPVATKLKQEASSPAIASTPEVKLWDGANEMEVDVSLPTVKPDPDDIAAIIDGPFCIEFCSGTAGLTAALRRQGFCSSFGIDKIVKAGSKAPVIKLDLCDQSSRAQAQEWLHHKNMVYAHFGVPCGTASRAREIYIEDGPKPLRSSLEPDGIGTLDGLDLESVLLANQIYQTACLHVHHLLSLCEETLVLGTTNSKPLLGNKLLESRPAGPAAHLCDLPQLHVGWAEAQEHNTCN